MKKFILMIALMFSAVLGVNAQTAIETPKLMDNVYVGVQGGVTTPLDFNSVFPLNAVAGLKIGKEFTPIFGANVEGDAVFGDNHYMNGKTFVKTSYVGVNGTLNLTNILLTYRADRTFTLSAEAGLGWLHNYNNQHETVNGVVETEDNDLGAKTGLVFAWNLGKAKAWQLYANPTVFWNLSRNHKIQFNKHDAQLGVLIGIAYKFKTSNGTHNFKVWNVGAMNDEINRLRAENADLKNRPAEVVKEIVEKPVTVTTDRVYTVSFKQNSAELTDTAKTQLDLVPENAIVDIAGSTSPEGTAKRNAVLAQERADAVKKYLEGRGVKVNSAVGGEAGRVAIITLK